MTIPIKNGHYTAASWIILAVLCSMLYVHFFVSKALVEIEIDVSQRTFVKIYWAAENQVYLESRVAKVRVYPDQKKYSFFLTDLKNVHRLRIDPIQYPGEATFNRIEITQKGYRSIILDDASSFSRLEPLDQIISTKIHDKGLLLMSSGKDPQFVYKVETHKTNEGYFDELLRIIFIFVLLAWLSRYTKNWQKDYGYIPSLLLITLPLLLIMASITMENSHPDEHVHLRAASYYENNWLPPKVDDPVIKDSYSIYGFSRLNSPEVSYFLAGKFLKLVKPLKLPDYIALRLFNVILFTFLIILLCRSPEERLIAAPLLLFPQIWYVFGYFNSDAFALFLAFLACIQLVKKDSLLNRLLAGDNRSKRDLLTFALLAVLFALLLLMKKNYYFFLLFAGIYFIWKLVIGEHPNQFVALKKIIFITLVGASLAGLRLGLDHYVNGADRKEKIEALQEEHAGTFFKPSTPLEEKHINLYRKARGVTLNQILFRDNWGLHSFNSSIGLYGYNTVSAPAPYYLYMRNLLVLLGLLILASFMLRGGLWLNVLMLSAITCSGLLIAASIHHSWASDFQPQGRYLLPIAAMLAIPLAYARNILPYRLFSFMLIATFLMSAYSFIFVGLTYLPKSM